MKMFEKDNRWNWVDENNVLVGFNNSQCCCENFGYLYTKEIPKSTNDESIKFDESKYRFDTTFVAEGAVSEDFDGGGSVTFKLVNHRSKKDVIYLTLFNSHNGYYGHGFDMTIGGKPFKSGGL